MKLQKDFNQYPIIGSKIEELYWYPAGDSIWIKGKCDKTEDISNKNAYFYNLYFCI